MRSCGSREGQQRGCRCLGRPHTSRSLPLSHPEKIFSETTPKCEKCQSVVKPGKPLGLGGLELGPLSPTAPLTPPLLPGPSPTLGRGWVSARPDPRPQLAPDPCLFSLCLLCFLCCPCVPLSVSTLDIVFFGENLPPRFFSCMQSVSNPPGLGRHGLGCGDWSGEAGPQARAAGGRGWGGGGGRVLTPHRLLPAGLLQGGPPYCHGHLPAGAALRLPHQQVGRGG